MVADWEVEIGPEAPIIDALWSGFVDLRRLPEAIVEIEEAQRLKAFAGALLRINGPEAVKSVHELEMWTAKCDLWSVEDVEELDAFEMDTEDSDAAFGVRLYIDLLPRQWLVFPDVPEAEQWARSVVSRLREIPARSCRVDLILRRALAGDADGVGITAYLTGCGANEHLARVALSEALDVFAKVIAG